MLSIKPNCCVLFAICLPAFAATQSDDYAKNLYSYQREKFHAGTHLGITSTTYAYRIRSDRDPDDSLYRIDLKSGPGFNFNCPMAAWSPVYNVHLRINASISFHETIFNYSYWKNGTLRTKSHRTDPTRLNFPVQLKFNANRINNFGAYALGGFCPSYDLASQKKVVPNPSDPIVRMKPLDLAFEVGAGFDFFLEYFKFGIEVKMQNGVRNLLIQDDTFYSRPLESLKSRIWWVHLTFET